MIQIRKDNHSARPLIQIVGDNDAEVLQWAWFFYNRGAINNVPELEDLGQYSVIEFSCEMEKLIKCYELSAPLPSLSGKGFKELKQNVLQARASARENAIKRIAALPLAEKIHYRTAATVKNFYPHAVCLPA